MPDPADVFTVISPTHDLTPLHGQRALGERKLMDALMTLAFNELRLPVGTILHADALAWFISGDRGIVTCLEACEFLGLEYGIVRELAIAGHRLPKRRGNPRKESLDGAAEV